MDKNTGIEMTEAVSEELDEIPTTEAKELAERKARFNEAWELVRGADISMAKGKYRMTVDVNGQGLIKLYVDDKIHTVLAIKKSFEKGSLYMVKAKKPNEGEALTIEL